MRFPVRKPSLTQLKHDERQWRERGGKEEGLEGADERDSTFT